MMQTGKLLKESDKETGHQKTITSLSKSADGSHFITGSSDKSSKVKFADFNSLYINKIERMVNILYVVL